jgi:predicted phosphoadenosine phosphosulfate sulfurtransferase
MAMNYSTQTVLEAALDRLNFVFDECDDIVVGMSGGKDSTVLFHLAHRIAAERGRLPLRVTWLDQEAEWQATVDFMRTIMYRDDVVPYWWQIPFRLTNSLSFRDNYLYCWREADRAIWLRPQDPISLKVNPTSYDRFHDLIATLPSCCGVAGKRHVGVLVGMRASESPRRRATMTQGGNHYKGVSWCHQRMTGNTRVFWPLYDWQDHDIWACIAKNGYPYNTVYDQFYRYGVPTRKMRVSALIHETSWNAIERLHEVEPGLYNRMLRRVNGVGTFDKFGADIVPKDLPPVFKDWREYRDYLLENLIEPQYRELFRRRWATGDGDGGKQVGEQWWRLHVREIVINDIDGTVSDEHRVAGILKKRRQERGTYEARRAHRLEHFLAQQPEAE